MAMPPSRSRGPGVGPARPATPRTGRGPALAGRVDHADAHLLLVLLGPVRRAGQRGGHRRGHPQRGQQPGLVLLAAGEIQDTSRQPGPDGGLRQHRVQRVPEPHAVQRVADFGGPDQPGYPLPGGDHRVETGGLLETVYRQHAGAAARPAAR